VLIVLLGLFPVQAGCAQEMGWGAVERLIERDAPGVPRITTDSLAERLADRDVRRPLLLDARAPDEYAVSHLPGALRVDPDAEAFPMLDTVATDTPIVVYCSVGYRSAKVTERLREQGYANAVNLQGSIFRWANEGRPVVRDGERVRQVHPYDAVWGQLLDAELRAYTPAPEDTEAAGG
jgi:rhodanese-related sulfurtransferase